MLYNLDPAIEIKGRVWYTGGEFDADVRDVLAKSCLKFIKEAVRFLPRRAHR